MRARNGWLFPLMVLAAGSVMVFGCIGIAAITGYLPLAKASRTPLGESVTLHSGASIPLGVPMSIEPDHAVALASPPIPTEQAGSDADQKPLAVAKKPGPQ